MPPKFPCSFSIVMRDSKLPFVSSERQAPMAESDFVAFLEQTTAQAEDAKAPINARKVKACGHDKASEKSATAAQNADNCAQTKLLD